MYRAAIAILLVVLGVSRANGQTTPGQDLATADALFLEGQRLSMERRFAEACARFEASMALSARLGVALNLADCYEHLGRTASAWVAFGEAAALAHRLADVRETFALQRQQALVPRLSRLRIVLAGAAADGLAVTRDGVRVYPAAYGVGVPVDPGVHVVDVAAPGRNPWSTRIAVAGEGELATIEIPELERTLAPPAAVPAAPAAVAGARLPTPAAHPADPDPRRVTPVLWASLGVAVAGVGTAIAFGAAARSLEQQARRDCDASGNCTDAAAATIDRSRHDGNISTAAFAVAGAALVSATVLYLWRGGRQRAVQLGLEVVPRAAGLAIARRF